MIDNKQHLGLRFLFIFLIALGFGQGAFAQFNFVCNIQAAEAYETGQDLGFWDVQGSNTPYKSGQNIQVSSMDKSAGRKFMITPDENREGYYNIRSLHGYSYGRLDVAGGIKDNGTNVQLSNSNGSTSQSFRLEELPNGNFKIFNHNGMVLSLSNKSYANGSNVHTWENHDGHWTEWVLINANYGYATANKLKAPKGKVSVPSGYNVQDVELLYYTNKYRDNPLVTKPNANGEFSFSNAQIPASDRSAALVTMADGLVSEHYDYHFSRRERDQIFNLKEAPAGTKLVKTFNRGNLSYKAGSKYWENTTGEVKRRDDFFFRDITKNTPEKKQLRELIGVSGADARTDQEIYQIAKKTWKFFKANTKGAMGAVSEDVTKAMDESMNRSGPNAPVSYWTTIEQFVQIYNKYGFMPVANCTSQALAMAALLRVAGIPADKMAVEILNYDYFNEHWAVIIEMKGAWYWFDPTHKYSDFPDFDNLRCIPESIKGFNYDLPYEIILLPGSSLNYVPYCGREGIVNK